MDVWDVYFSTLVGWQLHPAHKRYNNLTLTLNECADLADEMVRIKEERKKHSPVLREISNG